MNPGKPAQCSVAWFWHAARSISNHKGHGIAAARGRQTADYLHTARCKRDYGRGLGCQSGLTRAFDSVSRLCVDPGCMQSSRSGWVGARNAESGQLPGTTQASASQHSGYTRTGYPRLSTSSVSLANSFRRWPTRRGSESKMIMRKSGLKLFQTRTELAHAGVKTSKTQARRKFLASQTALGHGPTCRARGSKHLVYQDRREITQELRSVLVVLL